MRVMVIGAAGMIGHKLVQRLLANPESLGEPISVIDVVDVIESNIDPTSEVKIVKWQADLSQDDVSQKLMAVRPEVIFQLAAIVSGEAETEFDKGYRINMQGSLNLLEAIRQQGHYPRLVMASSIAVFGAPFAEVIEDDFALTPLTSYGTQKAIGELLLNDYTRKGFVDGIGLRFPTIVVRPGSANLAASGFFSNIIREPLVGKQAILPVSRDVMHWMASPRAAVDFCIHAARLNGEEIGPRRNLTLPGVAVTVAEMIEALGRAAGPEAEKLIVEKDDPAISSIIQNWPEQFNAARATELGFRCETTFDEIIQVHIDDELGGEI